MSWNFEEALPRDTQHQKSELSRAVEREFLPPVRLVGGHVVLNEYGAPVADVRVIATAADGRTGEGKTNGDGWYEIANAPADAALTLTTDRPGFLPQTYGDPVYVGVRGTASALFQLARNAFDLSSTVKDIGGTPVPGAVLRSYGNNGRNYDVTADSEGRYTLPRVLADNAYNIVVTAEGQSDAEIDGVWYGPGTQQTLDITFPTPVVLKNPSFEIWGKDKYDVVGWTAEGTPHVFDQQGPGTAGVMNLAGWSESAFEGNLYQDVTVDGGTYTLTCQVMNGGGEESLELYLMDADGNRTTYDLLQVGGSWTKVRIQAHLPAGLARIGIQTKAKAGNWFCVDDVKLVRNGD